MDAAIDHFIPMGYNKAQVRSVVNALLKVPLSLSSLFCFFALRY